MSLLIAVSRTHARSAVLTVLASAALFGCGGSANDRPEALDASERSGACRALREGFDQFAREHPDVPVDQLRRQTEESCRSGKALAPTGPPPPTRRSPGCDALEVPGERPLPLRRRTLSPPKPPPPFFARRAGALPPNGTPAVGGVRLPRGSRCLHHWATDAPVRAPGALAARLAGAFPRTGLWPVLWDSSGDGPDNYAHATGDPAAADRLNVEEILRGVWSTYGMKGRFPGLAPGSGDRDPGSAAADPFGTLAKAPRPAGVPTTGSVVMLVPVNRPADVASVLGLQVTEVMSDDALTAVLRSWEERFRAVVTTVGAGTLGLVVDAPPSSQRDARKLAAEQAAFAPEADELTAPGGLEALATRLRSGAPQAELRSRLFWSFGWPD